MWASPCNSFEWLASPKLMSGYKRTMDENIRTYMELRSVSWSEIMSMPYLFFMDDLKWKIKFEDDKRKRIKEQQASSKDKAYRALQHK